jgi:AAA domain
MSDWLIDGADLLAEPDPGPTPWLVQDLIVDQALAAVVGRWKTTKSWGMLEIAVSVATGTPAFGSAEVPQPGPIIYVIEESGRRALRRRLDALCRGRAIYADHLRGRLLLAANARVKLDNIEWQTTLLETGLRIRPRAFIFDPLARMKDPRREENDQTGMAPVIEYLRLLRDETNAATLFVHHTGHQGEHMRGSSDLESAWESRLAFKRDGDNGAVTVRAEHREEESGAEVVYVLDWHHDTRTMRLRSTVPPLAERIVDFLRHSGPARADEIAKGIQTRPTDVRRVLGCLSESGTAHYGPSGRRDKSGRPIRDKVWQLSNQAGLWPVPDPGRNGTSHPDAVVSRVARPASLEADGERATAPDTPGVAR